MKLRYPFDGNYRISQKFGGNPTNYAQFDMNGHNGLDIALPDGTPVLAAANGTVSKVGYEPKGYGHYIKLKHSVNGEFFETTYGHGKVAPILSIGHFVCAGEQILISDNSGYSSGPHLHFGLRMLDDKGAVLHIDNGYKGAIDPMPYLTKDIQTVSEWAKEAWQWALDKKYINAWDNPQEVIGTKKLAEVEFARGKITKISDLGETLEQYITSLYRNEHI